MGNSSHIIYYINLSIIFIIGFPIIVYSFWLLYLNWDTPLLLQRRRSLSVLILILVSVLLLFFEPLITSFYLLKDTTSAFRYYPIFRITYALSIQTLFVLYGLKVFILYFDCGYAKALSSKKWKILLNPKLFEDDWFVQNKHKYGESKYIVKVTSILLLLMYVIETTVHFCMENPHDFWYIATVVVIVITLFIDRQMWKSFPSSHDTYQIRNEFLFVLQQSGVALAIHLIPRIITVIIDESALGLSFAHMSAIIVYIAVIFSIIIVPTYYNNRTTALDEMSEYRTICANWHVLITSTDGFELFMDFLQTHFATQHLLFAVEYMQLIKAMLTHQVFIDKLKDNQCDFPRFALPASFPLSSVIATFDQKVNSSYFMDSTASQSLQQIQLKMLSRFITRYRGKRCAFMAYRKYQSGELHELWSINYLIQIAEILFKKYIEFTAPLWIKIDSNVKRKFDEMFATKGRKKCKDELSQLTANEIDIFVDIMSCFQSVFVHVCTVLDDGFCKLLHSKQAILL
eukprot:820869_1